MGLAQFEHHDRDDGDDAVAEGVIATCSQRVAQMRDPLGARKLVREGSVDERPTAGQRAGGSCESPRGDAGEGRTSEIRALYVVAYQVGIREVRVRELVVRHR